MKRKERIKILDIELKELASLFSAMKDIDQTPEQLLEMATEKASRILSGLKNIDSDDIVIVQSTESVFSSDKKFVTTDYSESDNYIISTETPVTSFMLLEQYYLAIPSEKVSLIKSI